mgnify:CR=1 FL=1
MTDEEQNMEELADDAPMAPGLLAAINFATS